MLFHGATNPVSYSATNPHDPGPGDLKVPQIPVIPQRRPGYLTAQQILMEFSLDQVTSQCNKSQWHSA